MEEFFFTFILLPSEDNGGIFELFSPRTTKT